MTKINRLIERAAAGETPERLLGRVQEASPNPLVLRKQMRDETPELYAFLNRTGQLQDFALDLPDMDVATLMDKYEIPAPLHQLVVHWAI